MAPRTKSRTKAKNISPQEIRSIVEPLGKGTMVSVEVLACPEGEEVQGEMCWNKPFTIEGFLEKTEVSVEVGMFTIMSEGYYGDMQFSECIKSITITKHVELPENTVIKDKFGVIWTKHHGQFVSPGGGTTDYESLIEPKVVYLPEDEDDEDDE